jgi:rare lipoprotein A
MLINIVRLMISLIFVISMMGGPGYAGKASNVSIGFIGDEKVAHVTVNDTNTITIKSDNSNVNALNETKKIALSLNKLLYEKKLRADRIMPAIHGNDYVLHVDSDVIFSVNKKLAKSEKTNPSSLTLKWANNLRTALGGKPITYRGVSRSLSSYSRGDAQYGYASWYGGRFQGRRTSSGEVFNTNDYTAAHRYLPLGTQVMVTNLGTGRSVMVKINDRGPFVSQRIIDLSSNAFRAIAPLNSGVIRIRMDVLN